MVQSMSSASIKRPIGLLMVMAALSAGLLRSLGQSVSVASPLPFLLLGLTFLLTGTLWCLLLACAAAPFGGLLRRQPVFGKMMNRISGLVFVGLGMKIGLSR